MVLMLSLGFKVIR